MAKKLNIEITYGCGKVVVIKCNSKKQSDSQYKVLVAESAIWSGSEYTRDYTVKRIK